MNIGDKLKVTRKQFGYTQEEISEKIHVSRQTISSWENSKSLPDVTSLILFSDLYDLTLDELIKGDENMMKEINKNDQLIKETKFLGHARLATEISLSSAILLYLAEQFFHLQTSSWLLLLLITNTIPYLAINKQKGQSLFVLAKQQTLRKAVGVSLDIITGFLLAFLFSRFL
ncbi:helix-turn-helix transcriptional regulator [Enterococcus olivae]